MLWEFDHTRAVDLIAMGRVAVDLYAEQIGCSIENAETFRKYLGGCAGNIAVGTARLGLQTVMFSCVGKDAFGQFIKQELQREKVDISLVQETARHLTGLVILGISPPDHFPLIFYREQCADMQLKKSHINRDIFATAKALLITGTGLSTPDMCEVTHVAVDTARTTQTRIVLDLDYRPVLWNLTEKGDGESRFKISDKVSHCYQTILPKCDLIVGTEEEILIAGQANSLDKALQTIRTFSEAPIVVKKGAKGCATYFSSAIQPITARAFPVNILNVLGAGDAFLSGFLRGLLRGESWETAMLYGNASGAIVVTRHGCAPAMPTFTEIQALMQQHNQKDLNHVRISCSSS